MATKKKEGGNSADKSGSNDDIVTKIKEKESVEAEEISVEELIATAAAEDLIAMTPAVPDENFDWDGYKKGVTYSREKYDSYDKSYEETLNSIQEHSVVMGQVAGLNKKEIVIN